MLYSRFKQLLLFLIQSSLLKQSTIVLKQQILHSAFERFQRYLPSCFSYFSELRFISEKAILETT